MKYIFLVNIQEGERKLSSFCLGHNLARTCAIYWRRAAVSILFLSVTLSQSRYIVCDMERGKNVSKLKKKSFNVGIECVCRRINISISQHKLVGLLYNLVISFCFNSPFTLPPHFFITSSLDCSLMHSLTSPKCWTRTGPKFGKHWCGGVAHQLLRAVQVQLLGHIKSTTTNSSNNSKNRNKQQQQQQQ